MAGSKLESKSTGLQGAILFQATETALIVICWHQGLLDMDLALLAVSELLGKGIC
jgi:hypothetical protein